MRYISAIILLLFGLTTMSCKKEEKSAKDISGMYVGVKEVTTREWVSSGPYSVNDSSDTTYSDTVIVYYIAPDTIAIGEYKFPYSPMEGYHGKYWVNGSGRTFNAEFIDENILSVRKSHGFAQLNSSYSYSSEFVGVKQ